MASSSSAHASTNSPVIDLCDDDDSSVAASSSPASSAESPGFAATHGNVSPPTTVRSKRSRGDDTPASSQSKRSRGRGGGAAGVAAGAGRRGLPEVTLLPHQHDHAARLVSCLRDHAFAIDTSMTGSGKTHTACFAARQLGARQLIVVCPIAVRSKWQGMMGGSEDCSLVTYSMLNRTASVVGVCTFKQQAVTKATWSSAGVLKSHTCEQWEAALIPGSDVHTHATAPGTLFVIDESHSVKNDIVQASAGVHAIAEAVRAAGGWVLNMSATPLDSIAQFSGLFRLMLAGRATSAAATAFVRRLVSPVPASDEAAALWFMRQVLGEGEDPSDAIQQLSGSGGGTGGYWTKIKKALNKVWKAGGTPAQRIVNRQCFADTPLGHNITQFWVSRVQSSSGEARMALAFALVVQLAAGADFLGCDVELAVHLLIHGLPKLLHGMAAPPSRFKRFDADLFLENADVSEPVVELTVLPAYLQSQPGGLSQFDVPAPLVSLLGRTHISDPEVVRQWRSDRWKLGERMPANAWRAQMQRCAPDTPAYYEAKFMANLCEVMIGMKRDELEEKPQVDVRIRLETAKVEPLAALVVQLLEQDPTLKVTVLFNYLEPLRAFHESCCERMPTLRACPPITGKVVGSKRSDILDTFKSASTEERLLCAMLKIVNQGIDLHDTRGDSPRITFIMASGSAIDMGQAQGRIHRAGVMSHALNCIVYGGHSKGGLSEQRLLKRLEQKKSTLGYMNHTRRAGGGEVASEAETTVFYDAASVVAAARTLQSTGTVPDPEEPKLRVVLEEMLGSDIFKIRWYFKEVALRMFDAFAAATESAAGCRDMLSRWGGPVERFLGKDQQLLGMEPARAGILKLTERQHLWVATCRRFFTGDHVNTRCLLPELRHELTAKEFDALPDWRQAFNDASVPAITPQNMLTRLDASYQVAMRIKYGSMEV